MGKRIISSRFQIFKQNKKENNWGVKAFSYQNFFAIIYISCVLVIAVLLNLNLQVIVLLR